MKHTPKIVIENSTIFLTLDLKGLGLYERGKAIRRFINSDTKIVEDYADTMIRSILRKNGICINSTDKQVLQEAFDTLKAKGKTIEVIDFYKDKSFYHCEYVSMSSGSITVILEDNRYLECAIEIKEIDL